MAILFLIFLDQICPKWIKLDQSGFLTNQKSVTIKCCHIYSKDKNGCFVFDFLDQIRPKSIKLDQIGFPHQFKNVAIKGCHIYRKDQNGSFVFDFFRSDLSKMDRT